MTESITAWLDDQIGLSGQYLWLRKSDGTLLNTGGDALAESPAGSGQFVATVAESRTSLGTLRATITGSSDPADTLAGLWLAEGSTVCVDDYPSAGASGGLTTDQNNTLNAIAAAVSGKVEAVGRVAEGGQVTAYIGDDFKVRSGTALTIPISDVGGVLYTKLTALGADKLRFGVTAPGKAAGLITGTIASISQSGSGASQLCNLAVEITNCGASLPPGDQYLYQIEQEQTHSAETDDFVEIEGKFKLKQRAV